MSMEKGNSIHKKSNKLILNVDEDAKQVKFLDKRFYTRNNEYYPSITTILQYYPKGKYFEEWLKQVGFSADIIAKQSADEGTQTHTLIERYLNREELKWIDEKGNTTCSINVWQMFLKFVDFWTTYNPTLIESECHLYSDKNKIAGTCDLVILLNNQRWLIDLKTSNNLHTTYDLQTAAYAQCWYEMFGEKIERTGILWLKSNKHKPSKNPNQIQGKGWEIYESPRPIKHNWQLFKYVHKIYKLENSKHEPFESNFPYVVKLEN